METLRSQRAGVSSGIKEDICCTYYLKISEHLRMNKQEQMKRECRRLGSYLKMLVEKNLSLVLENPCA